MNKHYAKNQSASRYKYGAIPTTERHRHLGGLRHQFIKAEDDPNALVGRYRARWASPLDLYRDKQIIDRTQHQAGLRFGRSYHHAVSGGAACRERSRRIDSPTIFHDKKTGDHNLFWSRMEGAVPKAEANNQPPVRPAVLSPMPA